MFYMHLKNVGNSTVSVPFVVPNPTQHKTILPTPFMHLVQQNIIILTLSCSEYFIVSLDLHG